jgi:hypothetical protein
MRFTMLAAILLAVVLGGCGSGGSSSSGDQCQVGAKVDTPTTQDGVPACADNAQATLTYGCYPQSGGPQDGSWYAVEVSPTEELYGKPGGAWVKAASPSKLDEAAIKAIGC